MEFKGSGKTLKLAFYKKIVYNKKKLFFVMNKKLLILLLSFPFLSACGSSSESPVIPEEALQATIVSPHSTLESDYKKMQKNLDELKKNLDKPNVLKSDILRGWYLGTKDDKKFGTPDTWIFVEDGLNSRWMSPGTLDDGGLISDRELCRKTAGTYISACTESSEEDCEYTSESHCECSFGSSWEKQQGCILTTEKGSFVSMNNAELKQGWYLGSLNEKKLNTPENWIWVEDGKNSSWRKEN